VQDPECGGDRDESRPASPRYSEQQWPRCEYRGGHAGQRVHAGYGNNRIVQFSPSGVVLATWGSKGTGSGQFSDPEAVGVDGQGDIFVADTGNNRVEKLHRLGHFFCSGARREVHSANLLGPLGSRSTVAATCTWLTPVTGASRSSIPLGNSLRTGRIAYRRFKPRQCGGGCAGQRVPGRRAEPKRG
jgi:hypothetical protein